MVDTDPRVGGVLEYVEGVNTVSLFAWKLAILGRVIDVLCPHRVNSIFQEEVGGGSLTKTKDSSEGVLRFSRLSMSNKVNPVEIFSEKEPFKS
jgi:hypothetical protein